MYVGSTDNYLYAISPSGTLLWRYLTGSSIYSSPAIGLDGTIYVGSQDSYLYALSPTGALTWRYLTGNAISSSPAVASDGMIYVGSNDHYFYAISAGGVLNWQFLAGDYIAASPVIGFDGTVYIGCYDNYLYAFYTHIYSSTASTSSSVPSLSAAAAGAIVVVCVVIIIAILLIASIDTIPAAGALVVSGLHIHTPSLGRLVKFIRWLWSFLRNTLCAKSLDLPALDKEGDHNDETEAGSARKPDTERPSELPDIYPGCSTPEVNSEKTYWHNRSSSPRGTEAKRLVVGTAVGAGAAGLVAHTNNADISQATSLLTGDAGGVLTKATEKLAKKMGVKDKHIQHTKSLTGHIRDAFSFFTNFS